MKDLKVSYSNVGEGRVAVNCEKTQFFLNILLFRLAELPVGAFKELTGIKHLLIDHRKSKPEC